MENKFYGYNMNGDEITENDVDALYRVAENEILRNSDFYKSVTTCTIDDDTFEFYATGTAFGASLDYSILATISEDNIDIEKLFKINDDGTYPRSTIVFGEKNSFVIQFKITVKNDCATGVQIDDISVYRDNSYNEYDTNNLKQNIDEKKFVDYFCALSNKLTSDIHRILSNF